MAKPLWRLRGSTDKSVVCCVEPTALRLHAVTIVMGAETVLDECHPDAASAMSRAMHVRDGLLKNGGWTVAVEAAALDATMPRSPRAR